MLKFPEDTEVLPGSVQIQFPTVLKGIFLHFGEHTWAASLPRLIRNLITHACTVIMN